jgi:hypothetical protein
MPILSHRDERPKTYYDVLDMVRAHPGVCLGGVDYDSIRGTLFPRLLAFLSGLHFAGLDAGEPAFQDFGPWFSVRVDGISDSHNMPFNWLEETHKGGDSAFDAYFARLDEFRSCKPTILESNRGPFQPAFKVGLENPQTPEAPDALIVGRYHPSSVCFWGELRGEDVKRSSPFCRNVRIAKREASDWWGVPQDKWEKVTE